MAMLNSRDSLRKKFSRNAVITESDLHGYTNNHHITTGNLAIGVATNGGTNVTKFNHRSVSVINDIIEVGAMSGLDSMFSNILIYCCSDGFL